MTPRRASLLLTLITIVSACAPRVKPVHVDMIYMSARKPDAKVADGGCRVGIIAIEDDRSNKETLGAMRSPIIGHGVMEWMRAGIHSLESYGHELADSAEVMDDGFAGVAIHVSVRKTFCRVQPNRLGGVVVMSVRYERAGVVLGQRSYRGYSEHEKSGFSSANYSFSDGAIRDTLTRALDDAVARIDADLRGFCLPGGGPQ